MKNSQRYSTLAFDRKINMTATDAFTKEIEKNIAQTPVEVSRPWNPNRVGAPPPRVSTKGVWDTGATYTTLDLSLVRKLGLTVIRWITSHTVNGPRKAGVYVVNLYITDKLPFYSFPVIDGETLGGEVLIGMDIIATGDFAISRYPNQPRFSFRHPSQARIDFTPRRVP